MYQLFDFTQNILQALADPFGLGENVWLKRWIEEAAKRDQNLQEKIRRIYETGQEKMLSRQGSDYGQYYEFAQEELDKLLGTGMSTGIASITVAEGDNHIIVVSGANFALSLADIDAHADLFAAADVVLCQLEIPMDCVLHAAQLAKQHGATFVLNPAPAQILSAELLALVDVMTPNHTELKQAFALSETASDADIAQMLPAHMQLVMTEGANGASHYSTEGKRHWPAFKVDVVDTTGAGDTFNAGLAVYWSQGLHVAVQHAQASAALAVQKLGAQTAMPTADAVGMFIKQQVS